MGLLSRPQNIAGAVDAVQHAKQIEIRTIMFWPGDSSSEITLYDNASAASGTKVFYAKGTPVHINFESNIECKNGLYAVQTGTNSLTIYYI